MKVGVDIDGVLADFDRGFIDLIRAQTGVELPRPSDSYPDTWNFPKAAGIPNRQINEVWERVKATDFWLRLSPLPGAIESLQCLNAMRHAGHDIYFITSRPGSQAKFLTELWLMYHGMAVPTVLIASQKGPIVRGLELDVFVDDKPENVQDAADWFPITRTYLIDRPYNRGVDLLRATSLNAVLDIEFPMERRKAA